MTDAELKEALHGLGMDESSYRALPLLPLVQVAWADGSVQDAERDLILHLAGERYHLEDEGQRVLRNWLHHSPSPDYARRGKGVLVALCERSGFQDVSREGLEDLVGFCQEVARAAGGFFGFGAIDSAEAAAIEEIAEVLHVEQDRRWVAPDDETLMSPDADRESDGPAVEVTFHSEELAGVESRATLVEYDENKGEQACPVTEAGVTIGRARENTIQINYDAQVSRRHCRVFARDGRYYVEDQQSTRGTWVNGERIVERRLLGGETLHVGSATLFFQLSPV